MPSTTPDSFNAKSTTLVVLPDNGCSSSIANPRLLIANATRTIAPGLRRV